MWAISGATSMCAVSLCKFQKGLMSWTVAALSIGKIFMDSLIECGKEFLFKLHSARLD